MLVYKLCGTRHADHSVIPKLTKLTSAMFTCATKPSYISKRASASSTVPFGLRWELLYSAAIRTNSS
eukprot:3097954-Prorocentrum_lima.AAC.1